MKKVAIACLCLTISLFMVTSASADILKIPGNVNEMVAYGGYYTGAIEANLNDVLIDGGIVCLDYNARTYVPNPGYEVYVSTLSPVDLSHAKFGSDSTALFKYQEAAWLLGQMADPSHSTETGQISFAIWRIFTPSTLSGASAENISIENAWIKAAALINPADYDFSSVRIYTATDTLNQEFMSGMAIAGTGGSVVPIPPAAWLLGSGLIGLVAIRRRFQK
jgi:hypothetical protein